MNIRDGSLSTLFISRQCFHCIDGCCLGLNLDDHCLGPGLGLALDLGSQDQCWKWPVWAGVAYLHFFSLAWKWNHTATSFCWLPYIDTVLLPPNAFCGLKISHTCICSWGSALGPAGGAYSAPSDPTGDCGRGEEQRSGKVKGREREEEWGRGGEQVHTGSSFYPPPPIKTKTV